MKHFMTFLLLIGLFNPIYSQSDTLKVNLSEIVITATKTETPSLELANSISIITSEEIESSQKSTLAGLLREVPGISIAQQGGLGTLGSLFLRGGNANHTLFLIDGVEMNNPGSPNNAYDFGVFQASDIERIEIVKGPQSTLYGSDATAGIINVISKKPSEGIRLSVFGEGGSNNYFRNNISGSGTLNDFNYKVNYGRIKTDGISVIKGSSNEKDAYQNNTASALLGYNINSNFELNFNYRFTNTKSELDQSNQFGDDPNYYYNYEEQFFKGDLKTSFFDGKLTQRFSGYMVKQISSANDEADLSRPNTMSENYTNANRTKYELINNFSFIENHKIILGLETEIEKAYSNFYSESEFGPYESIFPTKKAQTNSIYLQDQIKLWNKLFTSLGFRYDYHDQFGSATTFRIAPAYYISSTNTKLRATYGTGFKAPSLFNLYDPGFGNENLSPEKSLGYDFGIDQYLLKNKFMIGITYFRNEYDDLFGFDENFRTINIDKALTEGIELDLRIINFYNFSLIGNYTYTKAIDKSENSSLKDEQLLRRPENSAFIALNYKPIRQLNLRLSYRYSGERYDNDFSTFPAERVTLKSFSIVDFTANYKIWNGLKIFGRVENLFDENYEEVHYYGTRGQSFYAGISFDFDIK